MAKGQKKRGRPLKSIWSVAGLEKRCQELILTGALTRKNGLEEVVEAINSEFDDKLQEKGKHLSQHALKSRLRELVWTAKVISDLEETLRHNIPLKRFQELHPWIPEEMIRKKAKRMTGINESAISTRFIAGMGRLSTKDLPPDAELFEFPDTSFAKPFEIEFTDRKGNRLPEWTASVINGANLGIRYDRVIKSNWVRRALSDAEKRGDKLVVLVNCINVDTKKSAGPLKVYRAQVSGLRTESALMPESYRPEVERLLRDRPVDEVVFEALETRFINLMRKGWGTIVQRPDNKGPEFTGQVIVILGYLEEELINAAAYNECRWITIRKRKELETEIRMIDHQIEAEAKKRNNVTRLRFLRSEQIRLAEQLAMTIITNVTDEDIERHRRRMRAYVVQMFQEVIPNCKVISQGSANVRINGEMFEFHVPSHTEITDGLLASYVDEFGAKVFRDAVPRTAIICHPYALQHRFVGRDDSEGGQRSSSMVHIAPIVVDAPFLRHLLQDSTRMVHQITKAIRNEQFEPGVLVLHHANNLTNVDSLPVSKLDDTKGCQGNLAVYPYPETKYITIAELTDFHFGGRSREEIWVPWRRQYMGVVELVIELMRREGLFEDLPIHLVSINDDPTQGNHFGTHQQPDPKEIPYPELEKWWQARQTEFEGLASQGRLGGHAEHGRRACPS